MDKERLKYVLREAEELLLPSMRPRAVDVPLNSGKVIVLVGIRRSGKTFLLLDVIRRLQATGVDRRQIVALNFEDDRLQPLRARDLDAVLHAHAELHPAHAASPRYFLFDEVQNAPGWERFVRRLHDTRAGAVFVTGSSSKLLSREIATGLRGRCLSYEVFPLSFAEYLTFRGLSHEPYSALSEARMAAALDDYLQTGGLPEVVLAEEALRPRILREYVDLVFYRDLVERHGLSNPLILREMLRHCLASPATLLSPHRLYLDLRSRGLAVGKDTLYRYLRHLEEAYLVYLLPVADRSLRKQAMQPKKLHVVDWSLGYPYRPGPLIDRGRRLENAVFLHHRRQREDLAYLGGPQEIDLAVGGADAEAWVNTAWSLSEDETWRRECAAIQRPGGPQTRWLIARETAGRAAPAGVRVADAWRYLAGLQDST
ncbi:ATP-binding protein [Candidatus Binatia bacterium]|nr:ATP-binding protein [Candidatus Binatia bacterium]